MTELALRTGKAQKRRIGSDLRLKKTLQQAKSRKGKYKNIMYKKYKKKEPAYTLSA
jgi:hypothetical protein